MVHMLLLSSLQTAYFPGGNRFVFLPTIFLDLHNNIDVYVYRAKYLLFGMHVEN